FFELLDRGRFDRRIRILVADQPGRELDAASADRDPRLVDQDHFAVMFGENNDRVDVVGTARIFPFATLERAHEAARPHDLGRREVVEVHGSISLSGISFTSWGERGKCSASTTPTRSIAATMPSAGRPSRTCSSSNVIASPQV